MSNVTMSLDDHILKEARKIAIEKNSTFSELVRKYLTDLVQKEKLKKGNCVKKLEKIFNSPGYQVGTISWTREDLHGR